MSSKQQHLVEKIVVYGVLIFIALVWVISSVLFVLVLFVLWCIYKLVFGYFLKKLTRNYQELEHAG